ncbi:hypothetical protein IW139_006119, partial [Coemansia sp. RSA 353]
ALAVRGSGGAWISRCLVLAVHGTGGAWISRRMALAVHGSTVSSPGSVWISWYMSLA